jgi:hypothetical protein
VFAFRFLPRQWYHVALVHDKGSLFSDSAVSLFVDGMHTQSLKLSYPKIDPMVRGHDFTGLYELPLPPFHFIVLVCTVFAHAGAL